MINLASLIERIASKTTTTGTGPMAKVLGKAGVATGGQFAELVRLAATRSGGLPGAGAPGTTASGPVADVSTLLTKASANNVVPFTPPAGTTGQTADITLTPAIANAAKASAATTVTKATTAPAAARTAAAKTTAAATAAAALGEATTAVATAATTASTATKTAQPPIVASTISSKQASPDDTAESADIDGNPTDPTTARKKPKTAKTKAAATGPVLANAALAASDTALQAQQLANKAGRADATVAGDAKGAGTKVGQVISSNPAKPLTPSAALPAVPATAPAKTTTIREAEAPAAQSAKASAVQRTEAAAANRTRAPAPRQAEAAAVDHSKAATTGQAEGAVIQQAGASATASKTPASKTGATLQASTTGQPTTSQPAPGGQEAAMAGGQQDGTDTGTQPRQDASAVKTVAGGADGTKQRTASVEIAGILPSLPPGIQSQLGVSDHAAAPMNGLGTPPIMAPSTAAQLSGQVIDMGVSGQWIDRMAHEISALAQGTGHSQFQLSPANLGKIQIDLWQGDSTTNIRMLTETTDAAQRLDQGKHMLHADARLAALQIGTISIEKATPGQDQSAAQRQAGNMGGQPQRQDGGQAQSQGQAGGNRPNHWSAATPARDATQPSDNQPTDRNANRRWRFA